MSLNFVTYKQWKELPESANTLFSQGEQESLFLSRVWLENLTAHSLNVHQSLLVACVLDGQRCLAILPMMKSSQGGLSSLSNHFTTLYSLLVTHNGPKNAILDCLADGLSQMPVQSFQFEPIDKSNGNIISFSQFMQSRGFHRHAYFRFYNWMHPLNGQSYDEYMAERPTNLRNTIKRKQRKLEREHGYDIRLYKDTDIDTALIDYQAIYKASWKANEFYSEFTPSLVKRFSRLGWLRLAILYSDNQPVAAQLWFVVYDKANIYRLVYDEKWKNYSPGSILTKYLMRYVIDTDKVSEIDFLTGNERYKQDWMSIRKERTGLRFVKQSDEKSRFGTIIQSMKKLLAAS